MDLSNPWIEPGSPASWADFLTTEQKEYIIYAILFENIYRAHNQLCLRQIVVRREGLSQGNRNRNKGKNKEAEMPGHGAHTKKWGQELRLKDCVEATLLRACVLC